MDIPSSASADQYLPLSDDEKAQLRHEICTLLGTCRMMKYSTFFGTLEKVMGKKFPFRELGFASPMDAMKSFTDIVSIRTLRSGEVYYQLLRSLRGDARYDAASREHFRTPEGYDEEEVKRRIKADIRGVYSICFLSSSQPNADNRNFIYDKFRQYGKVTEVKMDKGWTFVRFDSYKAACNAVLAYGKQYRIQAANPGRYSVRDDDSSDSFSSEEENDGASEWRRDSNSQKVNGVDLACSLEMKNVPAQLNEVTIESIFRQYAISLRNSNAVTLGSVNRYNMRSVFVDFANQKECEKALQLSGKRVADYANLVLQLYPRDVARVVQNSVAMASRPPCAHRQTECEVAKRGDVCVSFESDDCSYMHLPCKYGIACVSKDPMMRNRCQYAHPWNYQKPCRMCVSNQRSNNTDTTTTDTWLKVSVRRRNEDIVPKPPVEKQCGSSGGDAGPSDKNSRTMSSQNADSLGYHGTCAPVSSTHSVHFSTPPKERMHNGSSDASNHRTYNADDSHGCSKLSLSEAAAVRNDSDAMFDIDLVPNAQRSNFTIQPFRSRLQHEGSSSRIFVEEVPRGSQTNAYQQRLNITAGGLGSRRVVVVSATPGDGYAMMNSAPVSQPGLRPLRFPPALPNFHSINRQPLHPPVHDMHRVSCQHIASFCRHYPNCKFGFKCNNKHKWCRKDVECKNEMCMDQHSGDIKRCYECGETFEIFR